MPTKQGIMFQPLLFLLLIIKSVIVNGSPIPQSGIEESVWRDVNVTTCDQCGCRQIEIQKEFPRYENQRTGNCNLPAIIDPKGKYILVI